MEDPEFLRKALNAKRLTPRYCKEDIGYLGIRLGEKNIEKVAVLEKCFCDIQLHSIMQPFSVERKENGESLTVSLTHPDIYGKYGLAFSKEWGIRHNLQPIHYINPASDAVSLYRDAFITASSAEDLDNTIADEIISRICYIKPLTGDMPRKEGEKTITYHKNFHDEREWRFVPPEKDLQAVEKGRVIFKNVINDRLNPINTQLEDEKYKSIALNFDYDDIRYILVPDDAARDSLLHFICRSIEFNHAGYESELNRLISKILVLDELGKDW